MARLRANEWNFTANVATQITRLLDEPRYTDSLLGHAEAELTEVRGARRLDLVIFARDDPERPLVTAEIKMPWDAEGRSPFNAGVLSAAHGKAARAGSTLFLTWNVRRLAIWRTDDPGVQLEDRVVYNDEIVQRPLRSQMDLRNASVQSLISDGIVRLIDFLDSALRGRPEPTYLPLDQLFIARLESALYEPLDHIIHELERRITADVRFKRRVEEWMRDVQGWPVAPALLSDNIDRATRFTAYMLVNKLCFYNALRRKYTQLGRLTVANNIGTGEQLQRRLRRAFDEAERFTGDYETVFEGDFGDSIPFVSDSAVSGWRRLIRSLDQYDFAQIPLDVIGSLYEKLIRPEERHRYGQHYTLPPVVDLMNEFAIPDANTTVLDPACGGGTFLVRAYSKARLSNANIGHAELISQLYGCDISSYACHLSTTNLAIRDLIDDDNFPRIHLGNFLELDPGDPFVEQPVRLQAGGLPTGTQRVQIEQGHFGAVVGNPPYIDARDMGRPTCSRYHQKLSETEPNYRWARDSNIYVYFWIQSKRFLAPEGMVSLLTQSGWLDVEYGFPLQEWLLDNFRIIAILESNTEPWFTDARVATAITVARACDCEEQRNAHRVRFVTFRKSIREIVHYNNECDAYIPCTELIDQILAHEENAMTDEYQVRLVPQETLREQGTVDNTYRGSKWGRHLRCTPTLYQLQNENPERFVELGSAGRVQRGITTNCDEFFLVEDVTDHALNENPGDHLVTQYGINAAGVAQEQLRIIQRQDGSRHVLEDRYLEPILRTGRGVESFVVSQVPSRTLAVCLPEGATELTDRARAYVRSGERERWHERPSFRTTLSAGGSWFSLRRTEAPPVIIPKAFQYAPLVILNDNSTLINQRLYGLYLEDPECAPEWAAILNSTIACLERYAAVKSFGREAYMELEVFSASWQRTINPTGLPARDRERLREAVTSMSQRTMGPLVEAVLLEAGVLESEAYIASHEVVPTVWPRELNQEDRQSIDRVILLSLGIEETVVDAVREQMYNELVAYTRSLRRLELQAQVNRRGQARGSAVSARVLADEIWAHLEEANVVHARRIPDAFVEEGTGVLDIEIPLGRQVEIEEAPLFDPDRGPSVRVDRKNVFLPSIEHCELIVTLARNGFFGHMRVPIEVELASVTRERIEQYLRLVERELDDAVNEVTGDAGLADRIKEAAIRRLR